MSNTFTPQEVDIIYQSLENIHEDFDLSILLFDIGVDAYGSLFNSVCEKLENYTIFTTFTIDETKVILDALQLGLGFDVPEIQSSARSAYKKSLAIQAALEPNAR